MNTKFIPVVLFIAMAVLGCADDKNGLEEELPEGPELARDVTNVDPNLQACDSVFIATYSGTACCISGSTKAEPGDTVNYHYQINHKEPKITSWEIREGDIKILKGQDSHTVTVVFGPNFTSGTIGCVGSGLKSGIRNSCSDRVNVKR